MILLQPANDYLYFGTTSNEYSMQDESKTEYLSVVTLGNSGVTQFYNSTGPSVDAANDNAALEALRRISECGLLNPGHGHDAPGDGTQIGGATRKGH